MDAEGAGRGAGAEAADVDMLGGEAGGGQPLEEEEDDGHDPIAAQLSGALSGGHAAAAGDLDGVDIDCLPPAVGGGAGGAALALPLGGLPLPHEAQLMAFQLEQRQLLQPLAEAAPALALPASMRVGGFGAPPGAAQ